jgi:hypothetical protein
MKPLHLMCFATPWKPGHLLRALYQGLIKCQKRQNRPIDFKALTQGSGTYRSVVVDTTHTYDIKSNRFCKLLSIKNIDNFLHVIFLGGRFRATIIL